ncbi:PREDICTED: neuralized-like protein 4 [Nicrophorus vespilloides]|uniref:Neuralized-like protein 4 n=1 Tax=Nicrophorus vespilloides TaxID=110193 RepID=A0ABM1NAG2_NICVS|nr:PREDICTED: neuralized-like protein 4 [Nicrophorus vespilloides]
MAYFHYRCGERITLQNENCTAVRNESDFDHGMVLTAEPLMNDLLFEIKIDKKVNSWTGNLEIGVTDIEPLNLEFPHCASKLDHGSWIMCGNSIVKDGSTIVDHYGVDLDSLNQDDRVGLVKTSEGDLIFYVNGESLGVAAEGLPQIVYGVVDLYGKCVQVTITSPLLREHNNDECLSGSSVLVIDNDILNVTLGGDISELSLSSSNSLDIRMDMNVSLTLPEEAPRPDKLKFHDRCGSLIKLSNGQRTGERRRPLDEFNNGVVMTHRPLIDAELFEIRIDRLVDKWSGSIEMGITTHNPSTLVFPATMTNMRSGTIMMSGCGILTNGKGTRREYGDFNLDELREGDRVGMMRKPDGNLHYFINGLDQGVAAERVPTTVWGVIDLYGMTIKVSIVERDEREEQNLMTRRNTKDQHFTLAEPHPPTDYYDRLTFHPNCGTHAQVINNGRTAHRPNAADDFNNGVVLTSRSIKGGEMFEVRLDRVVTKWAGSIEIGVTTHSPNDLEFPFTMTNVRSGTWMMTGSGIMHNGTTVLEQYGMNLDRLQVGDRVGVVRKENGLLHFFVNGVDQGPAASNVPEKVFGVIDLYGQAVEATIVDIFDYGSPDTINSSHSNTTLYSDLRFHHIHGRNAMIINNGLTAWRPQPLAEFNDGIVFSSRPLREGELFEISLDSMVDRWSGSIELGVTAVRPDDIDLPSTATDLARDTWMLSGSSVMENGITIKSNYPCDLDRLGAGTRIGVMQTPEKNIEFFKDGVTQGIACMVTHSNLYAVVDLYGQCAQVSITCESPIVPIPAIQMESCPRSDTSASLQAVSVVQPHIETDLHRFSDYHCKGLTLAEGGRIATRCRDVFQAVAYSATSLTHDELFEISIQTIMAHIAGSLIIGVTAMAPNGNILGLPPDCCYLAGNELHYKNQIIQQFAPSLLWLRVGDRVGILRTHDGGIKAFINGEELSLIFPTFPDNLYICVDLRGSCSSVSVLSRRLPSSPLTSIRLQDSLEIVLDQETETCAPQEEATIPEEYQEALPPVKYEFHENHGRNVEVVTERNVARRVASYNQGLVIVQPCLTNNQSMYVIIEQVDKKWQSSLLVGVVCGLPERFILPATALAFKGPFCIVASDWISLNGIKSRSNYGQKLNNLKVGDKVGLMLLESGIRLIINDCVEEILTWIPPTGQNCYAVFDMYGQCQQIKILNENEEVKPVRGAGCEKADLELCEKERPDANLSLPIPSVSTASIGGGASSQRISPITPIKQSPCQYQQDCIKFKKSLLLPDDYFLSEDPICYCNNCYRIISQDVDSLKDESLIGWVKFPLKNIQNIQTDKWHTAYYPTKLGTIRGILDKGQLLTKEQMLYSNLIGQRYDDVHVVFSPSLQQSLEEPFRLDSGRDALATFQLLVKPGAYSVARDCPEWSTKETGAISLHALLLQLKME